MFAISRTLQLDEWYMDTYSTVMLEWEKLFQWYHMVLSADFSYTDESIHHIDKYTLTCF